MYTKNWYGMLTDDTIMPEFCRQTPPPLFFRNCLVLLPRPEILTSLSIQQVQLVQP